MVVKVRELTIRWLLLSGMALIVVSLFLQLTDFGLSKFMDSASLQHTVCGTTYYLAPEIVASRGLEMSHYTKAVDYWSLGVVLFIW